VTIIFLVVAASVLSALASVEFTKPIKNGFQRCVCSVKASDRKNYSVICKIQNVFIYKKNKWAMDGILVNAYNIY
jgi:hypothetical protein